MSAPRGAAILQKYNPGIMHHVYFIESKSSGRRYIGYTTDLKRRLIEHNHHKNISTASSSEWKLIYCETYVNKMDALGREKFLKSGAGWRFLKKTAEELSSGNELALCTTRRHQQYLI